MKENQTNEIKSVVLHDSQSVSLAEIQARIFMIRGVQVMLDRDLAILYHVATKALNQAVKRNIRRFPERFMFQLTKEEFENWKSQIVTSNIYSQEEIEALKMGARRCPYAFTEQGVAQLSAVLHSDVAEDASVRIMDAFVAMRRFITANAGLFQRVECTVHTRFNKQTDLDFEKHNEQNAEIKKIQLPLHIHDRYLIVDDEVWLLGASAKDMEHGLCTVIKVDFTPEIVLSLLK